MALIGKIRRNSWLMVVMVALGVGGFLLMDIMTSGNAPGGGGSQMVIGKVEGTKIDRAQFEQTYSLLYQNAGGNTYANRTQLWNWYLEQELVNREAEALGLGVSRDEVRELEFGLQPSPIIAQRFSNPNQPGSVNREQLDMIKQLIDENRVQEAIDQGQLAPSFTTYWLHQRKEIVKDRLQTKLSNLVSKAMYTPNWMAEMGYTEQNQYIDFAYVKAAYEEVPNEEVSLTDEDLNNYLKANRARYERKEETRRLEYVMFEVAPTDADLAALRAKLTGLIDEFRTTDNDSNFVLRNEGIISPAYLSKDELSAEVADTLLRLPVGEVFGPYEDAGSLMAAKILDRAVMADSADTRHILIGANNAATFAAAEKRIDSLMNVLRAGAASFDSLAMRFSEDGGSSAKGGKYENVLPNQFVPEFNEVLFITGQIGQLYKIRTTYGYHLVEVLRRSSSTTQRAQVAFLRETIEPSAETQAAAFDRASQFIAQYSSLDELREAAANTEGVSIKISAPLGKNDFSIAELGDGNDVRDMICWAYSADPGDVSGTVYTFTDAQAYYDNKYVVAGLRSVQRAGLPSAEEAREEIEQLVINEKKAEILRGRIQGTDLSAIAAQLGTQVDTASNVNFAMPFVTGLGGEPKVLATAFNLAENQTSAKPIDGNTGVFMVKVLRKQELPAPTNLQSTKQRMNSTARSIVATRLLPAMVDVANVDDNRARFECGATY